MHQFDEVWFIKGAGKRKIRVGLQTTQQIVIIHLKLLRNKTQSQRMTVSFTVIEFLMLR